MRTLLPLLVTALIASAPASAQQFLGTTLDPPTLNLTVGRAVAGHFAGPDSVRIRDLHPSLARGGHGYCGMVAAVAAGPFAPFHVILDADGSNSLLVLPADGEAGNGISREDALRLLRNFGCIG